MTLSETGVGSTIHTIPIYGRRLEIEFDPHMKQNEKIYAVQCGTCAFVSTTPDNKIWMCFSVQSLCHSVVAHEAVHAAWRILALAGVKFDEDNHEAFAYLVGYITNLVWLDIHRYNKLMESWEDPMADTGN